jgi:hypothetical protein
MIVTSKPLATAEVASPPDRRARAQGPAGLNQAQRLALATAARRHLSPFVRESGPGWRIRCSDVRPDPSDCRKTHSGRQHARGWLVCRPGPDRSERRRDRACQPEATSWGGPSPLRRGGRAASGNLWTPRPTSRGSPSRCLCFLYLWTQPLDIAPTAMVTHSMLFITNPSRGRGRIPLVRTLKPRYVQTQRNLVRTRHARCTRYGGWHAQSARAA